MWSMRPRTSPNRILASSWSGTVSADWAAASPTMFNSATVAASIALAKNPRTMRVRHHVDPVPSGIFKALLSEPDQQHLCLSASGRAPTIIDTGLEPSRVYNAGGEDE